MGKRDGSSNSTRLRRLREIRGPLAVGRPPRITPDDVAQVFRAFEAGLSTIRACRQLGLNRRTWYRYCRRHGLQPSSRRHPATALRFRPAEVSNG